MTPEQFKLIIAEDAREELLMERTEIICFAIDIALWVLFAAAGAAMIVTFAGFP